VVIRQGAYLNDRGGIKIGKSAVIGSYARVYSHAHSLDNFDEVTLAATAIGDGAHIASHAIVLGGTNVAPGETIGIFPTDRV